MKPPLTFERYIREYQGEVHPGLPGTTKAWTPAEILAAEPGLTAEQLEEYIQFAARQPVPIGRPSGILTDQELIAKWNEVHPEGLAPKVAAYKPGLDELRQAVKLIEAYIAAAE